MNPNILNYIASYGVALLFALLVHAVVVGLMMFNWEDEPGDFTDIQPYYIEARVVSENPFKSKTERAKERKQSAADKRNQQFRATDARIKKEQANWEAEKKRLEEAHDKAAQQSRFVPEAPTEEPEEESVDAEALRAELEESLALAVVEEQDLRRAVTDDEKAMAYVAQIQREIISNWSRPPSARNGMQAILRVRLIPTGEVVDVNVEESSGNDSFDRSAVLAVRKAERFIVPTDTMRFERSFREFTVLFRPEDLRL